MSFWNTAGFKNTPKTNPAIPQNTECGIRKSLYINVSRTRETATLTWPVSRLCGDMTFLHVSVGNPALVNRRM